MLGSTRSATASWTSRWRAGLLAAGAACAARPARAAGAVAALAALAAVALSISVFPHLSDNNDEAVYMLAADTIRHGHLFPPAPEPNESFLPWLAAPVDGRFVTKYTPVHPAVIAAARLLTGTDRAALALIAAGAVGACYALAREVLGCRRQAAVAAALFAASPMTIVLSGTYLAYLSSLMLSMSAAAALVAGVRRSSPRLLALSGLVFGIGFFSRPFDALLFAIPFGLWWARGRRPSWAVLRREGRWIAAGAAPPLAAMLAYFWLATGSPLETPFTLLDDRDTIGFGLRRMFPTQPPLDYTPKLALLGVVRLAGLTAVWAFGGLLLFGLVVAGLRWQRGDVRSWLAMVAVAVPLGYAGFWGSYGSTTWGGPWRFGPFYWMPILAPLSILGAAGLRRVWRADRVTTGALVVAMAAVSGLVLDQALDAHRLFSSQRSRLYEGPRQALALEDPSVVFLPDMQGPWLLQPFALARNADLDARVLWALDLGPANNARVLRRFPDRKPYRVIATGHRATGARVPDLHFTTHLEPYPGGQP